MTTVAPAEVRFG